VAANVLLVCIVLILAWPRRTVLVRAVVQWYQARGEGAGPNPHDTLHEIRETQQMDHDIAAIRLSELAARPEPSSRPEMIARPEPQTRPETIVRPEPQTRPETIAAPEPQTRPELPAERLWAIVRPEPVGAPSAPPEELKKLEKALRGLV